MAVALMTAAAGAARAQGSIELTVRGPGAAPVPGAAVVALNVPLGTSVQGVTDGLGRVTLAVGFGLNRVRVLASGYVVWRDTAVVSVDPVTMVAVLDSVTTVAADSLWRNPADTLRGRLRFLLHLDSVGIVPPADIKTGGRAELRDSLARRGIRFARALLGGIEVYRYDDTLLLAGGAARDSAFLRARRLRAQLGALILQAGPIATGPDFGGEARVATDEVVMQFAAGLSASAVGARVGSVGGRIVFRNPYVTNEALAQALDGDGVDLARRAQSLPQIRRASVNFRVDTRGASAAAGGYDQERQWHLERVGAGKAWSQTTGAQGVMVGVLEVGASFDLAHPDLSPRLRTPEAGWDFTGCQSEAGGGPQSTDLGPPPPCWAAIASGSGAHSTGVAGLIAAAQDGSGVVGVCPKCRLMLLLERGSNSYAKEVAIEHAAANKARVLNASWESRGEDQGLRAAVEAAIRDGNMQVVLAAGDDNRRCEDWEVLGAKGLVVVGAVDRDDERTAEGVRGPCLSVVAPGSNLRTTMPNDAYGDLSGTSAAAPVVTGIAGLVLGAGGPALPLDRLREVLLAATDPVGPASQAGGHDDEYGSGRANACLAVHEVLETGAGPEECAGEGAGCPWWLYVVVGLVVFLVAFLLWPGPTLHGIWRWLLSLGIAVAAVLVVWLVCRFLV
jgi:subtilisin family serine protease